LNSDISTSSIDFTGLKYFSKWLVRVKKSIKYHLNGKDDILVKTDAVSRIFGGSFRKILTMDIDECEMETLRKHERTGWPLGDVNFIEKMEVLLDRKLKPQKSGPKKKIK